LLTTEDLLQLIHDIDNNWFKCDLSSFLKKDGSPFASSGYENQDRNIFLAALERQKEGYFIYYSGDGI